MSSNETMFKNVELTTSTLGHVSYPFAVRVDGCGFSTRFATTKQTQIQDRVRNAPFSLAFERLMNGVASRVGKEFRATITERHSDEISFVFLAPSPTSTVVYGGKIQKLSSVIASACTAVFNTLLQEHLPQVHTEHLLYMFDGRVLQLTNEGETTPRAYLLHRTLSASRNWIAEWCTTQLRIAGVDGVSRKHTQPSSTNLELVYTQTGLRPMECLPYSLRFGRLFKGDAQFSIRLPLAPEVVWELLLEKDCSRLDDLLAQTDMVFTDF